MTVSLHSSAVSVPLRALPIAAAGLDYSMTIVAANDQFERLCGRPDSMPAGQRLTDLVAEPDRAALAHAVAGLRLFHGGPRRCSIRAVRAKAPALAITIDVVRLGAHWLVPYLACFQAIPRRRQEDRVSNQLDRLLRPGEPRGDSERRRVSRFPDEERWPLCLAALSHELRGPLTAIRGWAQMAESGTLPPDSLRRALRVIARNATTVSDMIEQVFDLSRRASGSLVLKRSRLDLTPIAEQVVESLRPAATDHNISLTAGRAHAPLLIDGDPFRLEQVVRNLVENGIKFTPSGGRVHVQTACVGSFAELAVTDTGLGIPSDLLPVIFEPFRHEDSDLPPIRRGLGLGLTLVRELVQLHGGDVRALSRGSGQGATFIVRLPLLTPPSLHAAEPGG